MTIQTNPNDTNSPSEMSNFFNNVLKRFILIYSVVATLFIAFLFYIYQEYNQNLETSLLNQEETFVSSTTQAIQKEMQIQLMVMQMNTKFKFLLTIKIMQLTLSAKQNFRIKVTLPILKKE